MIMEDPDAEADALKQSTSNLNLKEINKHLETIEEEDDKKSSNFISKDSADKKTADSNGADN